CLVSNARSIPSARSWLSNSITVVYVFDLRSFCVLNKAILGSPLRLLSIRKASSGDAGLAIESRGDGVHHRGDAYHLLDRLARHAGLAQHLIMRIDAFATTIDRGHGQRPQLEIG